MKLKTSLILSLLVVFVTNSCTGQFYGLPLCPEEECPNKCERPKDPSGISPMVLTKITFDVSGCLCICGQHHNEPCTKDADCIQGFDCDVPLHRPDSQQKVCTCPCDDIKEPYCPSQYAECVMDGTHATCKSRVNLKCSEGVYFPVCVVWDNNEIFEYKNECFFVAESWHLSKYDQRWKSFPNRCEDVPYLLDNLRSQDNYPQMTEFKIDGLAMDAINWDPSRDNQLLGFYGSYFRPEPEPEPQ